MRLLFFEPHEVDVELVEAFIGRQLQVVGELRDFFGSFAPLLEQTLYRTLPRRVAACAHFSVESGRDESDGSCGMRVEVHAEPTRQGDLVDLIVGCVELRHHGFYARAYGAFRELHLSHVRLREVHVVRGFKIANRLPVFLADAMRPVLVGFVFIAKVARLVDQAN